MLGRYSIARGRKLADYPREVREAVRQDTRKHTRHVLRPDGEGVAAYLADPSDAAWARFERAYRATLARRFAADRAPFDALAELARTRDVYLGCNCPTAKNPDARRCHTVVALAFMQARYPELEVRFPG